VRERCEVLSCDEKKRKLEDALVRGAVNLLRSSQKDSTPLCASRVNKKKEIGKYMGEPFGTSIQ